MVYLHTLILNQTTNILSTSGQDTLKQESKMKMNQLSFVTTFKNIHQPVAQIIKNRQDIFN